MMGAPVDQDKVRLRPALWTDRPAIAELIAEMGGHEEVGRGPDPVRHLALVLERADARAVVAELGGRVVGYAELQAQPSSHHDSLEGHLTVLAVDPACRGRGVGSRLLAATEREAAALGCAELVLDSSEWREGAHRFYLAHGFVEEPPARRFRRRIDAPGRDAALAERFLAAAATAATAAATTISSPRLGGGQVGGSVQADARAEEAALRALLPLGLPILSEESGLIGRPPGPCDPWIALDPLDGSRNFRAGLPPWAISVGLVRGGTPVAGLVADLSSGRRWHATRDQGAIASGHPARPRQGGLLGVPGRLPAPRFEAPPWVQRLRVAGCTSVELCQVADGALAGYLGVGGQIHPQDLAAASAILAEAGACLLGLDGQTPHLEPDARLVYECVAAATRDMAGELLTSLPPAGGR